MKFGFFSFFLFLIYTGLAQNLKKPVEIPFQLSPNGHIMIKATINEVEGNFIFDTGAGVNLLTAKFAEKVKDLEKTQHFYTGHRATGEALQTDLWIARSFQLGEMRLNNVQVAVYDIEFPLDGLISLGPFTNHAVTIDFKNKKLVVETEDSLKSRAKEAASTMPLQITNVRDVEVSISTPVVLNDSLELNVGLDSGAGFDVYRFNDRYMKRLNIDSTTVEHEFRPSYFKPEEGNTYYTTKLSSLSDRAKQVSKQNIKATFIEGLLYEGIMGINWLGDVITIDIEHKRILVH